MKKLWLFAGLLAATLTLSVASAQTDAAQTTDWENVDPSGQTVTFWHPQTGPKEEALDKIVADFNSTNEYGITVNAEYQGNYGDIFQKMLPLLGTSDVPDLVTAYQNQAASYQLGDALLDINPLLNSPKWGLSQEDQADFFPGFFNADVFPTFNNERLGFPPNRSIEVMYYNTDWLTELGYDGPPTTPDEFREMTCKAAEMPFSGATATGSTGYELSIDASRLAAWTFAFGGNIYDASTDQFTYNSDAAVEAMTFLQSLIQDGCATIVTEQYGDQTDFGTGKTLFAVGSSSGLPFYRDAVNEGATFTWSVAAPPHTTAEPVVNIYGASVSMPKTGDEASELAAWLFLKYFTSDAAQAEWAQGSDYFPARQSVAAGLTDYFEQNPAYKAGFDLLPYGIAEPPVPGYDFVRDVAEQEMTAIVDGADVQETLNALNEEANSILADQLAQMQSSN